MNYIYSLFANVSRMLVGFVAVVVLSRYLDVVEFGKVTWWLLISTALGVIFDYGYTVYLSKEAKVGKYNELISSIKTKAVIVFLFFILFFFLYVFDAIDLYPILLILSFGFNSICGSFVIYLRVSNEFKKESILVLFNNLLILVFLFLFLSQNFAILALPLAFFLAKLLYLLYFLYDFRVVLKSVNHLESFRFLVQAKKVFPYFIQGFCGYLYINVDAVIMPAYVSESEVGYYQAASKIFFGTLLFIEVINSVLIPKVSKMTLDKAIVSGFIKAANRNILMFGFVLSVLIYYFSGEIVFYAFGLEYELSILYLKILVFVIFLRYVGVIYGLVITISGHQKFRSLSTICTLILMTALCLILMPIYGVLGGLVSLIMSHLFINSMYIIFCKRKFRELFIL
ncbi:oligosaccharide flippase family protein [Vibrio vulnificus]